MGSIIRPRPTATAGEIMEKYKVFTVMRYYRESDILVGAFDNYLKARQAYEETIKDIENGKFTFALGVGLFAWENGIVAKSENFLKKLSKNT